MGRESCILDSRWMSVSHGVLGSAKIGSVQFSSASGLVAFLLFICFAAQR